MKNIFLFERCKWVLVFAIFSVKNTFSLQEMDKPDSAYPINRYFSNKVILQKKWSDFHKQPFVSIDNKNLLSSFLSLDTSLKVSKSIVIANEYHINGGAYYSNR